ncbi:MAG: hypothetical protein LLG13_17760 [Bacteroidales bacterium]|nr:hypothetical protein [Bacteroidales bacterium]
MVDWVKLFLFEPLVFIKRNYTMLLLLIPGLLSFSQLADFKVEKIWDQAPHNAFTDLIRYKNAFYCIFREGSGHIPGTDGKIRILKSANGQEWTSVALLEKEGFDLRDPSCSVTSDGNLMVLMGGSVYKQGQLLDRACHVSLIEDNKLSRAYYRGVRNAGKDGNSDETTCYAESEDSIIKKGAFDSQNVSFRSESEKLCVCYFRVFSAEGFRSVSRTTSIDFINWSEPV